MAVYKLRLTIYDNVQGTSNVRFQASCWDVRRPVGIVCVCLSAAAVVVQKQHRRPVPGFVKRYKDKTENKGNGKEENEVQDRGVKEIKILKG